MGLTSSNQNLELNVGTAFSSDTEGANMSSLTFTSMGTVNGQQEWAAIVDGQYYQEVNDQGKAVLQYAQQKTFKS